MTPRPLGAMFVVPALVLILAFSECPDTGGPFSLRSLLTPPKGPPLTEYKLWDSGPVNGPKEFLGPEFEAAVSKEWESFRAGFEERFALPGVDPDDSGTYPPRKVAFVWEVAFEFGDPTAAAGALDATVDYLGFGWKTVPVPDRSLLDVLDPPPDQSAIMDSTGPVVRAPRIFVRYGRFVVGLYATCVEGCTFDPGNTTGTIGSFVGSIRPANLPD